MAYDKTFKARVIKYKNAGHTFSEVYEAFGIKSGRYYDWKKQLEENGDFVLRYPKTHKGKIDPDALLKLLAEHPDWYLSEFSKVLNVCPQAVQKRFVKMGVTRKKKLLLIQRSQKKSAKSI
jgi:transposase